MDPGRSGDGRTQSWSYRLQRSHDMKLCLGAPDLQDLA